MTTNLTSQTAPVTDEELDQMIWKLERDDMTPKLLSLMRELREVRRANAEKLNQPVSETNKRDVIGWVRGDYNSDDKRDPNAPLFMLGINDPSETWGVKYIQLTSNSPATSDGWMEEAEKLAESYGASFVIFRHGEEPVCADPTKFWFGFDPAAPKEVG